MGNTFMYHDSDIAEEVTLHFARQGITLMPVHDSFIVEEENVEECWVAMKKVFSMRYDKEIPIDITDIVKRTNRILKGPVVTSQSEESKQMADEIRIGIYEGDPSDAVGAR